MQNSDYEAADNFEVTILIITYVGTAPKSFLFMTFWYPLDMFIQNMVYTKQRESRQMLSAKENLSLHNTSSYSIFNINILHYKEAQLNAPILKFLSSFI